MNYQEIMDLYEQKGELTYQQVEQIISDPSFSEAGKMGLDYSKSAGWVSFTDAPFCIDKVGAEPVKVVVEDDLKSLIENMKKSAKEQSYDGAQGDNYEACFCLYGRIKDGKIVITNAFWDERGFKPNEYLYVDPDALSYGSLFDNAANVTTTSKWYDQKVDGVCGEATEDGSLVVIYGHTHPHRKNHKKINNYPSRTDIALSVEEAVTHYAQPNGTCIFLNAIINADGDLNIFGYDVESGKFFILNDVKYKNGEKIAAYTEGNYPIGNDPSGYCPQ